MGPVDCGPANLKAMCAGWGLQETNTRLRALCGTNSAGTSIAGLVKAAHAAGLCAEPKPLDLYDLRDHADEFLPAIVAVSAGDHTLHYVTIIAFRGDKVQIMDPSRGFMRVPFEELRRKLARRTVAVPRTQFEAEAACPENLAEIESGLASHGIAPETRARWLGTHSLFHIDDCLKYCETVARIAGPGVFGGAASILADLLEGGELALPATCDTAARTHEDHDVATLNSPVALVVTGVTPAARSRRRAEPNVRRRLARLLVDHWRSWLPMAVTGVGITAAGVLAPLAGGWVIDCIDRGWPAVAYPLLFVAGLQAIGQGAGYTYAVGLGRLQQVLAARFKAALIIQYRKLPDWQLGGRSPGELISRLEETAGLAGFVSHWAVVTITAACTLVLAVALLFGGWLPIIAIAGASLLLGAVITECFALRLRRLARDVLESSAQVNSRFVEMLRGLESIRMLGADAAAYAAVDEPLAASTRAAHRQQDWRLLADGATGLLGVLTTLGLAVAAYLGMSRGAAAPGLIVTSVALAAATRGALSRLLEQRNQIERQGIVLERFQELMSQEGVAPLPAATAGHYATPAAWRRAVITDVSFGYPDQDELLRGVDLELSPGRLVCLQGKSGAGKSTLMDIMCGLLAPQAGRLVVDGLDIPWCEAASWGVLRVEQEPMIFDGTILDNLLLRAPNPGIDAVAAACRIAEFDWVVDAHPRGFERRVGGRQRGLSGGEARRLCLARALLRNPRILLLDETLTSVDDDARRRIFANLRLQRPELCVLMTSHIAADLLLCDTVSMLAGGRITDMEGLRRIAPDDDANGQGTMTSRERTA